MCGLSLPAEKWHKEVLKINRSWFMQAARRCFSSMDVSVTCNVTHQFDFHTGDHMEHSAYQVRNQLHVPALNLSPHPKKKKKLKKKKTPAPYLRLSPGLSANLPFPQWHGHNTDPVPGFTFESIFNFSLSHSRPMSTKSLSPGQD